MAISMLGAAAVVGGSRGWSLERTAEVTMRNADSNPNPNPNPNSNRIQVTTRNARDALDPQRWGRLDLSVDLDLNGDLSTQPGDADATSEGQREPSAAEQRAAAAGLLDPMPPIGDEE